MEASPVSTLRSHHAEGTLRGLKHKMVSIGGQLYATQCFDLTRLTFAPQMVRLRPPLMFLGRPQGGDYKMHVQDV